MITGTIDCNADEQASSARGVERDLDMFNALTFMFCHAAPRPYADVVVSCFSFGNMMSNRGPGLMKANCPHSPCSAGFLVTLRPH